MKSTITENEYAALVGLLKLAEDERKMMDKIRLSIAGIVGDPGDVTNLDGHIDDAVWSDAHSAASLLRNLNIEIASTEK